MCDSPNTLSVFGNLSVFANLLEMVLEPLCLLISGSLFWMVPSSPQNQCCHGGGPVIHSTGLLLTKILSSNQQLILLLPEIPYSSDCSTMALTPFSPEKVFPWRPPNCLDTLLDLQTWKHPGLHPSSPVYHSLLPGGRMGTLDLHPIRLPACPVCPPPASLDVAWPSGPDPTSSSYFTLHTAIARAPLSSPGEPRISTAHEFASPQVTLSSN